MSNVCPKCGYQYLHNIDKQPYLEESIKPGIGIGKVVKKLRYFNKKRYHCNHCGANV